MSDKKKTQSKQLVEQMVRTEDIFCSLLYDQGNQTLRVVDFRGGNFQQKHDYLKRIQLAEGFRKIFTLIERDDMQGWQRCGYQREGSIPGYYRRSDAYVMGWLADEDWVPHDGEEETEDRREHINVIRELAAEYEQSKNTGFKAETVTPEEIPDIVANELSRRATKKGAAKSKKTAKTAKKLDVPTCDEPLFMQFSRGVEYYYFSGINKRTKQTNLVTAEYQDCFGNAKIDIYFDELSNKTDVALARFVLNSFIEWLADIGSVALFTLVDAENVSLNALYASCGFKNSGWLAQQVGRGDGARDQILWTLKLAT